MLGSKDKATGGFKKAVLGKGLSSLLGEPEGHSPAAAKVPSSAASKNSVMLLPIQSIEPNPHQPRKFFDEQALNTLVESIKIDGVIQPVIVTGGAEPGKYILIAGERRWRASKLAGKTEIPAILKEGASNDLLRLALIENIQRSDLNVIEEAEAYSSLIKDFGLTQDQCAQKVGKDRATVANCLRLLTLPKQVQDDIIENRITMGHGRALLSLEDKKSILRARDIVIKKHLSVRQTEALCKTFQKNAIGGASAIEKLETKNNDLEYIAESLRGLLRTKVKISGTPAKGKVEISYFSAAELERLLGLMGQKLA